MRDKNTYEDKIIFIYLLYIHIFKIFI